MIERLSRAEFQQEEYILEKERRLLALEQTVQEASKNKGDKGKVIFGITTASIFLVGAVLFFPYDNEKSEALIHDDGESSETSKEVAKGYPEAVIEDEGNGYRGLSLTVKGKRMSGIGHVPDRANYVSVADVIETPEGNTMVTIIFNTGETTVFIFEKDSGRVSRSQPWRVRKQ